MPAESALETNGEHGDGPDVVATPATDEEPRRTRRRGATVAAAAKAGDTVVVAAASTADPGPDRVDKLADLIRGAPAGIPKNIQVELAKSARLLPALRQASNKDLIDEVAIAVRAALLDPPNLELARNANKGVRRDLRFRSYTPATRMLVGVAILSYFFAFGWLLAGGEVLDLNIQNLVGPAIFGWLGSVASMVTRINNFRNVSNPLTIGATRPVLGSAFGIFTYLALNSGVVNFGATLQPAAYFAIAFVAGFSERFVPDLISQFESDHIKARDSATDATEATVIVTDTGAAQG